MESAASTHLASPTNFDCCTAPDVSTSISSSRKRLKLHDTKRNPSIPSLHFKGLPEEADMLLKTYQQYKVLHLPKFPLETGSHLTWMALKSIFDGMVDDDKDSWCVEQGSSEFTATDFLDPANKTRGYCSFLLHKKKEETLCQLPVDEIPGHSWSYGPAVWFFFGRNQEVNALQGRPEHTDAVSHDGTWHYQLSGSKTWFLRPTDELRKQFVEHNLNWEIPHSVDVECKEGDLLIINTRMWWHQTEIPQQDTPSVSYARDFHFLPNVSDDQDPMCNVDGVYAATEIEVGTVIFREDDMPECSLHRSKVPNCEIIELEDGTSAVVSLRTIALGEFFSVPESSDDDDSNFDGDDVEEEEGADAGESDTYESS